MQHQTDPQPREWLDKYGRRRYDEPPTFEWRGRVLRGHPAVRAACAYFELRDALRAGEDLVASALKPAAAKVGPRRPAPASRRPTGHAPREARNTRSRGSRRGTRAASSSSDDPDSDPEPLPAAALAAAGYLDVQAIATSRTSAVSAISASASADSVNANV